MLLQKALREDMHGLNCTVSPANAVAGPATVPNALTYDAAGARGDAGGFVSPLARWQQQQEVKNMKEAEDRAASAAVFAQAAGHQPPPFGLSDGGRQ